MSCHESLFLKHITVPDINDCSLNPATKACKSKIISAMSKLPDPLTLYGYYSKPVNLSRVTFPHFTCNYISKGR